MASPSAPQAIPSPQGATPQPQFYGPPHTMPPPPSGPPALRALQGNLQNPLPIIVAGIGLVLVAVSFAFPLGKYTYGTKHDPLQSGYYGSPDYYTVTASAALDVAIPLLILAVAATLAMASSARWLTFGRLATIGAGLIAMGTEFGRAYTWKTALEKYIDNRKGGGSDYGDGLSKKTLDKIHVDFDLGLWLLLAGVVILLVAVFLVRAARPAPGAPFGTPPPLGPVGYAMPPAPQHQTGPVPAQTHPPAQVPPQGTPAPGQPDAGTTDISVHDDPPSLSIYKPPKKS